jgi:hypothetical protein
MSQSTSASERVGRLSMAIRSVTTPMPILHDVVFQAPVFVTRRIFIIDLQVNEDGSMFRDTPSESSALT